MRENILASRVSCFIYCQSSVVVIVDASNKWTRVKLDPGIVRILTTNESIPSVLVLNKVRLISLVMLVCLLFVNGIFIKMLILNVQ